MRTRHCRSQGAEHLNCSTNTSNTVVEEKSSEGSTVASNFPETAQLSSMSIIPPLTISSNVVEQELRRSNRAKQAPVALILSGGNSKSYSSGVFSTVPSNTENATSKLSTSTAEERHTLKSRTVSNLETTTVANTNYRNQSKKSKASDESLLMSPPPMMAGSVRRERSISPTVQRNIAQPRPKRKKGSVDLDVNTLMLVKEQLLQWKDDTLNENEVIEDTVFLLKAAKEKARTFVSEVHGTKYDSDDDQSIFNQHLLYEQDHTLGRDLLKEAALKIRQDTSVAEKPRKYTNNGNDNGELLDQQTVTWLKHAVGLHRPTAGTHLIQKNSIIDKRTQPFTSNRTSTRQQTNKKGANAKRVKKDNYLDALADAIGELEKDCGQRFPVFRFRTSPPRKEAMFHKIGPEDRNRSTKEIDKIAKRKMIREKLKRIKTKPEKQKVKMPSLRICTSLRVLDQAWRDQTLPNRYHRKTSTETEQEYEARRSIPLHPQFVQAGIIHRPPEMESLISRNQKVVPEAKSTESDPVGRSGQFDEESELSDNGIEGPPALFAKHEHFYSDLDREWYRENVVAKTLGLSVNTPMTHTEWKSIRKRCKLKPRRFSTQFIASEVKKRNEYRRTVRALQRNPSLCPVNFPYIVYKPLCAGTVVKAFFKGNQTIQRGTIISYDQKNAMYLIEFEMEKNKCEYCPDTDIASCNDRDILVYKNTKGNAGVLNDVQGQSVALQLRSNPFVKDIELKSFLSTQKYLTTSSTVFDEIANNDAFLTLMEVIDTARSRKNKILSLLCDANTLAINRLPFGVVEENDEEGDDDTNAALDQPWEFGVSNAAMDHLQWLHFNLNRVNHILNVATTYFETLYGNCFSLKKDETPST